MIDPGAIHICVGMKPTGRISLSLTNTRTPAAARLIAAPENQPRARRLVTLLFGLCPIAQLVAFDTARAAALDCPSPVERTGRLAELAVVLEAIVETIRVLVADAGRITGILHSPEAGRRIGRMRAQLSLLTETLLAIDPCAHNGSEKTAEQALVEVTKTAEKLKRGFDAAGTLLAEVDAIAQTEIYGTSPDRFDLEHDSLAKLEAWARSASDFRAAARLLTTELDRPRGECEIEMPLLPVRNEKTTAAFAEELLNRMLFETGFELSPFWQGTPRLTGTLSRMRDAHPAVRTLMTERGISPASLLGSRLLELAVAIRHAKRLLALCRKPFNGPHGISSANSEVPLQTLHAYQSSIVWSLAEEEGKFREAISLVETARGLLAHAVRLEADGTVSRLRITSPTEWQFAAYGAGQRMLMALARSCFADYTPVSRKDVEAAVRRALFGLDPCVPLEFAYTGLAQRMAP